MTISNNELAAAIKILKSAEKKLSNHFACCCVRSNFAYFSDGYRAIRFPIDCEDKIVSLEDLETALKVAKAKKEAVNFSELPTDLNREIYAAVETLFDKVKPPIQLTLDPHYLKELCEQAIAAKKGNPRLSLYLAAPSKGSQVLQNLAVAIRREDGTDLEGCICPIQIRD